MLESFTQKMLESLDSIHSPNLYWKIYDIILPEVDRIHTKVWVLFQVSSVPGDT